MILNSRGWTLAALALIASGTAMEAVTVQSVTYSGNLPASINTTLPTQDTVQLENFTLPTTGNLTIFSSSYSNGGFQPNLTLYSGSGKFLASGITPGTSPVAIADPSTGNAFDGYLTASALAPGSYTLAFSDWEVNQPPTATNLSDGFINYGDGTSFADEMGNTRSGAFSASIEATATPEPTTLGMGALMLVGVGLFARKRLAYQN